MNDELAIRECLNGSRETFGVLVERYLPLVRGVCRAYLPRTSDLDDAVQDVFVRAYTRLAQLRHPDRFAPWLCNIARNICRNALRRDRRERRRNEEVATAETAAVESPDEELVHKETKAWVHAAIDRLPARTREAMSLRYQEGYSVDEIAGILGLSRTAVSKRLQYGREKVGEQLWTELETQGVTRPENKTLQRRILLALPAAGIAAQAGWASAAARALQSLSQPASLIAGAVALAAAVGVSIYLNAPPEVQTDPLPVASVSQAAASAPIAATASREEVTSRAVSAAPEDSEEDSSDPQRGPGAVRGVVYGPGGTPVAGADVVLVRNPHFQSRPLRQPSAWRTQSDAQGQYEIAGFPLDSGFSVFATKDGLVGRRLFALLANQVELDIELAPGKFIEGAVLSESLAPVAGAVVDVVESQHPRYVHTSFGVNSGGSGHSSHLDIRGAFSTTTDANGRFRVGPLLAEPVVLRVSAAGFAPERTEPTLPGNILPGITLRPGLSLRVRPLDARTGDLISDAAIQLTAFTTRELLRGQRLADGAIAFDQIAPGDYSIGPIGDDYVFADSEEVYVRLDKANNAPAIDVGLVAASSIAGRVYDVMNGKPIGGVEVSASGGGGNDDHYIRATTDQQGRFLLRGLRASTYTVSARDRSVGPSSMKDRWSSITTSAVVGPSAALDGLEFPLYNGATVSGVALDSNGNPVENVFVFATGGAYQNASWATTNSRGEFSLTGLPPNYRLAMDARKGDLTSSRLVELNTPGYGEATFITLTMVTGGQFEGTLVTESGQPKHGGFFIEEDAGHFQKTVLTRSDGRFNARGYRPGRYRVITETGTLPIQISPAGESRPVILDVGRRNIEMMRPWSPSSGALGEVRGVVRDQDRQSVPGAIVSVIGPGVYYATSDVEGKFVIADLPGNQNRSVDVRKTGHRAFSDMGKDFPGASEGEVFIEKFGTVRGQVLSAGTNKPIPNLNIALVQGKTPGNPFDSKSLQYWDWHRVSSPDGALQISTLQANEKYTAVACAPGFAPQAQTLEAGAGKTVELSAFALDEGGTIEGTVSGAGGAPVAGAAFYLGELPERKYPSGLPWAVSDTEGRYTLESLPLHPTKLTVLHPDAALTYITVTPRAGKTIQHDIRLALGVTVRGRITERERPMGSHSVDLHVAGEREPRYTQTDADGRFSFAHVGQGEATFRTNSGFTRAIAVTSSADAVINMDVPALTGEVHGAITADQFSKNPDTLGLWVRMDVDGETFERHIWIESSNYSVDQLPAGEATFELGGNIFDGDMPRVSKAFAVTIHEDESVVFDMELTPDDIVKRP